MAYYDDCIPGKDCDKPLDSDCCKGKVRCRRPRRLRDIRTECIFVEKVFDARLFKKEKEVAADDIVIPITPTLDTVETAMVSCSITSFSTVISQLFVNGVEVTPLQTISGPGGMQTLIPQTMVDTTICSAKNKGTKFEIQQKLEVTADVLLTVTGTGTAAGIQLDYSGSTTEQEVFEVFVKFDNFCFPPTSLHPISILDSCLANCFYFLSSFTFQPDDNSLVINGNIIFCMFCEKKLKVPVQICVLTTGPCKIKRTAGFCDGQDFPSVFNISDNSSDMDDGLNSLEGVFDIPEDLIEELEEER